MGNEKRKVDEIKEKIRDGLNKSGVMSREKAISLAMQQAEARGKRNKDKGNYMADAVSEDF